MATPIPIAGASSFVAIDFILSTFAYVHDLNMTTLFGDLRNGNGYCSMTFDLWIMWCARLMFLGLCYCLARCGRVGDVMRDFMTLICTVIGLYSVVKLLAYAETGADLSDTWFWMGFTWNIAASMLASIVVSGWTKQDEVDNQHERQDPEKLMEGEENEIKVKGPTGFVRILQLTRKEWRWYLAGFLFLLFFAGARVFEPFYVGLTLSAIFNENNSRPMLSHYLVAMATILTVSTIGDVIKEYTFGTAHARTDTMHVRRPLFANLLKQEIAFFDKLVFYFCFLFLRCLQLVRGTHTEKEGSPWTSSSGDPPLTHPLPPSGYT